MSAPRKNPDQQPADDKTAREERVDQLFQDAIRDLEKMKPKRAPRRQKPV